MLHDERRTSTLLGSSLLTSASCTVLCHQKAFGTTLRPGGGDTIDRLERCGVRLGIDLVENTLTLFYRDRGGADSLSPYSVPPFLGQPPFLG